MNILSRTNQLILAQYASSNVLLAFDFDGTLAPIVDAPARAQMRPTTATLLRRLSEAYPCVVISGRAKADLSKRLRRAPAVWSVGNHGIEPFAARETFAAAVRSWQPTLRSALASYDGIHIEDKVFSLAIHYRRSRAKRRAREAITQIVNSLEGARLIGGKLVINILPHGAPHKGIALERERARLGCDTAIYVGDDDTDEDVFKLDQPGRLLTIRVGRSTETMADYAIRSQRDLDRLLRHLVQLRPLGGHRVRRIEQRPHAAPASP